MPFETSIPIGPPPGVQKADLWSAQAPGVVNEVHNELTDSKRKLTNWESFRIIGSSLREDPVRARESCEVAAAAMRWSDA